MKNLKNIILLTGIFGTLLLSSCKEDDPAKMRQKAVEKLYNKGTVKIAVANSFETNKSLMWEGILLAQEKIEKENICPVKIELIKCEDGGTVTSGNLKAYEIASDKEISAVIGHGYSDLSLSCSLIYQYYGILHFNFISTIHTLTERNNPLIFSNIPCDLDLGGAAAMLCEEKGYQKLVIYYLENVSGTSISNTFELGCNNRGISIVARESYDNTSSDTEIERSLKRIKNNFVFDAVFLAGRMPSITNVIDIARKNEIKVPFIGSDTFDDPLFESHFSEAEDGKLFCVTNYDEETDFESANKFYSDFMEKYGKEADIEAVQAYDALLVLAKAIAKAASAVPEDIAEALHGDVWKEAAGPYAFDMAGSCKGHSLTFKEFKDGSFTEIQK